MIQRKKIGAFVLAFILATGFLNLDAGMGVRSTQLRKPFQKPVLLPNQTIKNGTRMVDRRVIGQAGQARENKGFWESVQEKGLIEGLKSWWNGSQEVRADKVESAKREQARELLEKNAVARKTADGIEQKLQQETDPSKKAWLTSQLETLKQFMVNNKKALGALGALAVAAGTAVYFAPTKGAKSAEEFVGQEPVLEQGVLEQEAALDQAAQMPAKETPETSLESPGSVPLTGEETQTSSLPSLLSANQSPASPSSLALTEGQGQELTTAPEESTIAPEESTTTPEESTSWQLIKQSLAGPISNNLSDEE